MASTVPRTNDKTKRIARGKSSPASDSSDARLLVEWYREVKRDLPWRRDRDPYRIWVSEVMLQQTTVAAVIPYYERFMKRFPNLDALASAPVDDVLENWAGLGYYSRARNLHRAAQVLARDGFPKSFVELIKLPGFGPYTARAVASLAFDERSGVLDGNVIRVLSRRFGLTLEWWKPKARETLQRLSDELNAIEATADVNQGLMELGATVCTAQSPTCLLCPWVKSCVARAESRIAELPLKRPRREREIWIWQPLLIERGSKIFVIENDYAPFLKGHWILPGTVRRAKKAPIKFAYKGSVTHHDIFVLVDSLSAKPSARGGKWIARDALAKEIPSSLIRKAIDAAKVVRQ